HDDLLATSGAYTRLLTGEPEAQPGGAQSRCSSLEGDRVLTEDTTEHVYHHPAPDAVHSEAMAVGLRPERLDDSPYWLLHRD
ncbi:MAG: hypothetical protein QM582_11785, partial [Micropruina sp.]